MDSWERSSRRAPVTRGGAENDRDRWPSRPLLPAPPVVLRLDHDPKEPRRAFTGRWTDGLRKLTGDELRGRSALFPLSYGPCGTGESRTHGLRLWKHVVQRAFARGGSTGLAPAFSWVTTRRLVCFDLDPHDPRRRGGERRTAPELGSPSTVDGGSWARTCSLFRHSPRLMPRAGIAPAPPGFHPSARLSSCRGIAIRNL